MVHTADTFVKNAVLPQRGTIIDDKVPMLMDVLRRDPGLAITPTLARKHIVATIKKNLI